MCVVSIFAHTEMQAGCCFRCGLLWDFPPGRPEGRIGRAAKPKASSHCGFIFAIVRFPVYLSLLLEVLTRVSLVVVFLVDFGDLLLLLGTVLRRRSSWIRVPAS